MTIRYNHMIAVAFEVISDDPDMPTVAEALDGLRARADQLTANPEEAEEALLGVPPLDTYEFEVCPECEHPLESEAESNRCHNCYPAD